MSLFIGKNIVLGFVALALLYSGATSSAIAQETQPGDACAAGEAGWFKRTEMNPSSEGGNMMFCNGSTWMGIMRFTSSGNLGIWNDIPESELDISGTGQMDILKLNKVSGLPAPVSPIATSNLTLDGISDVNVGAVSDNDVLTYDNATSTWIAAAPTGGSGISDGDKGDIVVSGSGASWVIDSSSITEAMLKAIDSPVDEECLTYEATVGDFEWQSCGSGGSSVWAVGSGDDIYYNSGAPMVGIGITDPNVALDIDGDIEYTGVITDVSDRRLKSDIENLPKGQLELIKALQGVSYKVKNSRDGKPEFGFIAQEVEPLYPNLVFSDQKGMLSLNYIGLIAPLVEAVKEQQLQLEKQNIIIEDQNQLIFDLMSRVQALEHN